MLERKNKINKIESSKSNNSLQLLNEFAKCISTKFELNNIYMVLGLV